MKCQIRQDIIDNNEAVPIEMGLIRYINEHDKIDGHRWINEGEDNEQFQVKHRGIWWNAQSIDFDFS